MRFRAIHPNHVVPPFARSGGFGLRLTIAVPRVAINSSFCKVTGREAGDGRAKSASLERPGVDTFVEAFGGTLGSLERRRRVNPDENHAEHQGGASDPDNRSD